tara:strand:+ start:501 stop:698 length:198 start_codon:yes stop_codon:yes gene_type:complete
MDKDKKWEKFKDWFIDRLGYMFVSFSFVVVGGTVLIFLISGDSRLILLLIIGSISNAIITGAWRK